MIIKTIPEMVREAQISIEQTARERGIIKPEESLDLSFRIRHEGNGAERHHLTGNKRFYAARETTHLDQNDWKQIESISWNSRYSAVLALFKGAKDDTPQEINWTVAQGINLLLRNARLPYRLYVAVSTYGQSSKFQLWRLNPTLLKVV